MVLTFIEGVVTGKKKKSSTLQFLVDSGAIYTLLPEKDWKAIGLKAKRRMTFTLADGTNAHLKNAGDSARPLEVRITGYLSRA